MQRASFSEDHAEGFFSEDQNWLSNCKAGVLSGAALFVVML